MSILLYGVGPSYARLATNDLTHDLRHQADRRASRKHHCKAGVSLPRSRMHREHVARPNRPQGSFIDVFPRPWPGGGLIGKRKPFFIDLGTSNRRYFVEVKENRKPTWDRIQEMVLDQVNSPNSFWKGSELAVNRVKSLATMEDLIAACRESWTWARE